VINDGSRVEARSIADAVGSWTEWTRRADDPYPAFGLPRDDAYRSSGGGRVPGAVTADQRRTKRRQRRVNYFRKIVSN